MLVITHLIFISLLNFTTAFKKRLEVKKVIVSGALNWGLQVVVMLLSVIPAPFPKVTLDREAERGTEGALVPFNGKCGGKWNLPGCRHILSGTPLISAPGRLRFTMEL